MAVSVADPVPAQKADSLAYISPQTARLRTFLIWATIPALAIAAYLSVLWLGFLSDDFVLLNVAKNTGLDVGALLPTPAWPFYRPVGVIVTWELGWQLWGYNPFPFHLLGLLLHAASSLVLGLWLAEITSRRLLGWLAGALFAVFPLHVEAVGWLAAQWDALAVLFGLLSLWLFTKWWRAERAWHLYALSLVCFLLGIFSKESLLTFLPVFPLAIFLLCGVSGLARWRMMLLSLVPFGAVIALNLGIRMASNSPFGYSGVPTDFGDFYWDRLAIYLGMLVAPVNSLFAGKLLEQVVGSVVSLALLLGLIAHGRAQWRLLLLGAVWIVQAAVPTLNLAANNGDLTNSRFLYLPSAGYAIVVAALLSCLVTWLAVRRRLLAMGAIALPLLAGIALAWVNLQPWHVASEQVESVNSELFRLIPPETRPQGMVWYVQDRPDNYAGAFIFRLGLDNLRYLTSPTHDTPSVDTMDPAIPDPMVNLNQSTQDSFVIRFVQSPSGDNSVVYIRGRTAAEAAPRASAGAPGMQVWDFADCSSGKGNGWQVMNASATCQQGKGLDITPQSADPQLINPSINLGASTGDARFLRLRVSVSYAKGMRPDAFIGQWYWGPSADKLDEQNQITFLVNHTDKAQVYWSFVPVSALPPGPLALRFDPINSALGERIKWMAADLVK